MPDGAHQDQPRSVLLDAFLRGVFAFVGLGALLVAWRWWDAWSELPDAPWRDTRAILDACADTLPVGLLAVVEGLARRRDPSRRRTLAAFSVALAVAFAAGRLAWPTAIFFDALIEKGATSLGALADVANRSWRLLPYGIEEIEEDLGWSVGLALLALARLRGTRLRLQSLLVALPAAFAVLRVRAGVHQPSNGVFDRLLGQAVAAGVVLPLAAEAARRAGDRAFARLTLEEPDEAPASRADAYRGLPGRLAYVATAALLLSVPAADRWRRAKPVPPPPSPEESARRESWHGMEIGMRPASGAAALAKETAFARLLVRPRAGALDPICVEVHAGLGGYTGRRSELPLATVLRVDGLETTAPVTSEWAGDDVVGLHRVERFVLGGLAPGTHSIAALTSMTLFLPAEGPPTWSGTFSSEGRVEVVPGSLRSEVALVTPLFFDPDWFLYASMSQGCYGPIQFGTEPAPVAVRSKVEFYEGDRLLAVTRFALEPGAKGWVPLELEPGRLARGKHAIRVAFTPDPDFALASSATVREILGASFARTFEVEAR
jgi:hypothetical protein